MSFVQQRKASIEGNATRTEVASMDDFHRKQQDSKAGENKKKYEAVNQLRQFRTGGIMSPSSFDSTGSKQQQKDLTERSPIKHNEAANRAAAAMFVGMSQKTPTVKANDGEKGKGTVRSLGEFYQLQQRQRQHHIDHAKSSKDFNSGYSRLGDYTHTTSPTKMSPSRTITKSMKELRANFQGQTKPQLSSPVPYAPPNRPKYKHAPSPYTDANMISSKTSTDCSVRTVSTTTDTASMQSSGQESHGTEPSTASTSTDASNQGDVANSNNQASANNANQESLSSLTPDTQDVSGSRALAPVKELEILPSVEQCDSVVTVEDYKKADYRGFVFVVHPEHGLMLLHCTKKKNKGPHHQLPGGHVDEPEFLAAAQESEDSMAQLIIAAQMGAARELFEETGIDMREKLFRLEPAHLRNELITDKKDGKFVMTCELKKRLYFFLPVTDEDFFSADSPDSVGPMTQGGPPLCVKLSHEHSGFIFEKDPVKSSTLLEKHSGGTGSKALLMAMKRDDKVTQASPQTNKDVSSELPPPKSLDLIPSVPRTPRSENAIIEAENTCKEELNLPAGPISPRRRIFTNKEVETVEDTCKKALDLPASARKSRSARIQFKIKDSKRLLDKRIHPDSPRVAKKEGDVLANLDLQQVKSLDLLPPPSRHNIFGFVCSCVDNFFNRNPDENSP